MKGFTVYVLYIYIPGPSIQQQGLCVYYIFIFQGQAFSIRDFMRIFMYKFQGKKFSISDTMRIIYSYSRARNSASRILCVLYIHIQGQDIQHQRLYMVYVYYPLEYVHILGPDNPAAWIVYVLIPGSSIQHQGASDPGHPWFDAAMCSQHGAADVCDPGELLQVGQQPGPLHLHDGPAGQE